MVSTRLLCPGPALASGTTSFAQSTMSTSRTLVPDGSKRSLCLLSIDGGGFRGISALIILRELMCRIQKRNKLQTVPKPCEIFDLAGGTSTGGLIVILLFRLEMSTDEAIRTYQRLAGFVFSERKWQWQDGTFKASRLEEAVVKIIMDATHLDEVKAKEMRLLNDQGPKCFVCATEPKSSPTLFRTWQPAGYASYDCTIVEAARATFAAPALFKAIELGEGSSRRRYIDAGHMCNNPTQYVLQEAARLFPSQNVSCVVSLGTGAANVIGTVARDPFQKGLPHSLVGILKQIAVDCEKASQTMTDQFHDKERLYFRLNVNQGLQDVPMAEWENIDDIQLHTENYLEGPNIGPSVKQLVEALTARLEVESNAPTPTSGPPQTIGTSSIPHLLDGRDPMSDPMAIPLRQTKNRDSVWEAEAGTKDTPGPKYVLAIDGGGFRGYACLVLLHHLMRQLTRSPSDPVPLPCQIFDLISGTSTGGLIAVLLGRMGLDCLTAMSVYKELGANLFGKFDAQKTQDKAVSQPSKTFEERLAAVVEKYTGEAGALMKNGTLDAVDHMLTDVFVTTVDTTAGAANVEPYRLRSYATPRGAVETPPVGHKWTICEIVRAALASSPYLDPVSIGSQSYQDAKNSGSSNPIQDALSEVKLRWSNKTQPIIVSLGTGLASFFPLDPEADPTDEFTEQLIRVAQDTEMRHRQGMKQLGKMNAAQNYFRLDPTAGLGDIDMFDLAKLGVIIEFTNDWLGSTEGYRTVERVCRVLKKHPAVFHSATTSDEEESD
ncbi:hypothetical protein M413DRAFT_444536 [Hebeloma cylindrosporum]|uniref:PNPLA domain-containing protein n=1 Tax=Hebeloma cylindrosporum TaxID=76867 RepID=A0A0C3CH22_HEBCY|nr:hypothetical protein M413DRAFT_444536 [Hebeloma cylindrosporum h7]